MVHKQSEEEWAAASTRKLAVRACASRISVILGTLHGVVSGEALTTVETQKNCGVASASTRKIFPVRLEIN